MQPITMNGITYYPGATGTWLGSDGKKYVSRGQKDSRQFMPISAEGSYQAPDAGDAMDGGAGLPLRGQDVRTNNNGVTGAGTNLSPKPANIPGFVRNPFASLDLDGTDARDGIIQDPDLGQVNAYGQRVADIGGKMYKIDDEALADYEDSDPNMAVNPDLAAKTDRKKADMDFEGSMDEYAMGTDNFDNDYGEYEDYSGPSANDMARRRAFLDAPMGTGPRELIEKRDAAMGIYNGQLQTEDGMVDMSSDQRNDYLNRGDEFLKDVMSGKIKLGKDGNYSTSETSPFTSEPTPFQQMADIPVQSSQYPARGVDFTDMTSVIPFEQGGDASPIQTVNEDKFGSVDSLIQKYGGEEYLRRLDAGEFFQLLNRSFYNRFRFTDKDSDFRSSTTTK